VLDKLVPCSPFTGQNQPRSQGFSLESGRGWRGLFLLLPPSREKPWERGCGKMYAFLVPPCQKTFLKSQKQYLAGDVGGKCFMNKLIGIE